MTIPRELISKNTQYEFCEFLVATSTMREIQKEFGAADIPCDESFVPNVSSQRRSLILKYYHSVDFASLTDVRKVLEVYESILARLEELASNEDIAEQPRRDAKIALKRLTNYLRRDGYCFENGRIATIAGLVRLDGLKETAVTLDATHLHEQLARIERSVETDPAQAIGSAKEIIETVCKTILQDRKITFDDKMDVQPLVRRTMEELKLVPEAIPNAAKGAESIRALLGNLSTIAQRLTELRNLYGTGHGREGRGRGLLPRHARLAVSAAAALVTFLLETHQVG